MTPGRPPGRPSWRRNSSSTPIEQSLALGRQRLAASVTLLQTLMGREPAEAAPPPPALDDLAVPPDAPVSLPSQLVRERPDILEAEANLHQASAQVGVATAALFPSISITGDYGAASTSLASLASPAGPLLEHRPDHRRADLPRRRALVRPQGRPGGLREGAGRLPPDRAGGAGAGRRLR